MFISGRNRHVRFFKRAQICIADLHSAFDGKAWGAFTDLDHLTAFADYKVLQVLRQAPAIEYAPSLAHCVDQQELVAPGSEQKLR